ncbi:MAG: IS5 family transposase [Acidobacteriia bacterium]|nr:IS5 family transposase [Terriglobia bacterium]
MRGQDEHQDGVFSYIAPEERIPQDHPLRAIRGLVDPILKEMSPQFARIYANNGRPSIPPERLLRALLLQIFYSIRSERLLMEQLDYNLLFRWFVGMSMDERMWVPTVFTKNRERLLKHAIAENFFGRVLQLAQPHLSDEHFTVDGTLIEAWASQKSFRRKDGSEDGDGSNFHGTERKNDTHQSGTDADARLYRKSNHAESKLSYLGHTLVENRSGMIVGTYVTRADGYAERDAALLMMYEKRKRSAKRFTLGADKGYDVADFVERLREMNVAPHVARKKKGSAIDERTSRHASYKISQAKRYWVEKPFGWMKTVGGMRKVKLRGIENLWWLFTFTAAAFNLWRIPKLRAAVC